MRMYFKGRLVSIADKYISKELEERQEGESWLDMRQRTKQARINIELENKQAAQELKEILEGLQ